MMTIKERIARFGKENYPFYLVEHDDGTYSLCLVRDFLRDEDADYGQYAFDAYAIQNGEPTVTKSGLYTHGNGYEWGYVFTKAFRGDPEFGKISFDCESGGFFCYTAEFDLLENYGRRFKQLVEDKESFTRLVAEALKEEDVIRKEQEKLHNQVRGFLMRHRRSDIDMLTPYGRFLLTAKVGQNLLNGRMEEIRIGETVLSTDEFLSMTVTAAREDLIEPGYFQVKTESAKQEPEQNSCMSMSM